MEGREIIMLGGGGHARMLQLFLTRAGHRVLGFVSPEAPDTLPGGMVWLGDDDWLAAQGDARAFLVNGIGSTGATDRRTRTFRKAAATGRSFLDYVHPSATVDTDVSLGIGLQVLAGAIIQPGCHIGDNVLVNTAAVVEHDVGIADHVHIAPRACICGGARVEEAAHIGAGAIVSQGCVIGRNAVVGAGAVVVRNVLPGEIVVGVPAYPVTGRKPHDGS